MKLPGDAAMGSTMTRCRNLGGIRARAAFVEEDCRGQGSDATRRGGGRRWFLRLLS